MSTQENLEVQDSREGSIYVHWADTVADRIINEKRAPDGSEKDRFTCASGITPSGVVHIGNFREIMSVDLVVRALRRRGKTVRFIYSWDDYDVFRKVPKNMPKPEMLKENLRISIDQVPDPWGEAESYARHHELKVEKILPAVGIHPEFLYQAKKYRSGQYAANIRTALEKKERIKEILNEFRTTDDSGDRTLLGDDWWPISVFSSFSNKDTTTITAWDGEWKVSYRDDSTGQEETVDLRQPNGVKLPWRIDWPMRWMVEGVDFEPAGKDHHSEGGSWSTASVTCEAIFGIQAPITFKYDFVRTKGRAGKMSSSSGEVIDLYDVLEVYTPELCRFIFAGTRPNTEFAISFDLDVIKIYEDFDKTERIYYGREVVEASHAATAEKVLAKEKRIYELSQIEQDGVLPFMPLQIPFRHLCNLLLIYAGDADKAIKAYPGYADALAAGELDESTANGRENLRRARNRAACAWKWLQDFAPEDMKFKIQTAEDAPASLTPESAAAIRLVRDFVEGKQGAWGEGKSLDARDEKEVQDSLYGLAKSIGMEPKALFQAIYTVLVARTAGPRLGSFLRTLGKDWLVSILSRY